jgi:hypothetical protein
MEFLTSLLHKPLMIAMAPVRRNQIPNDMVGKVGAANTMIMVGLMALGALVVGLLIDLAPIRTAIVLVALGVTGTAILQWFAPKWLHKIHPKAWEDGERYRKSNKPGQNGQLTQTAYRYSEESYFLKLKYA